MEEEEEEILTQDGDDDLEEDFGDLEDEIKEEKPKPIAKKTKQSVPVESEQVNETYEGFQQPARLGIVNTINGDVIEGFETGKDEGLVQLGKAILNKLDKIGIASGV